MASLTLNLSSFVFGAAAGFSTHRRCSCSHPVLRTSLLKIRTRASKSFSIKCQDVLLLSQDELLKTAAERAVDYVKSGMVLGLGSGSIGEIVVDKIGKLLAAGELTDIVGVPTSKKTQEQAQAMRIPLSTLDLHPKIDLTIDGADEVVVEPNLALVKGRDGGLVREKMVVVASDEFIVVSDDRKLVSGLGGSGLAMPVEVVQLSWKKNLVKLQEMFGENGVEAKLRVGEGDKPYVTENSNYIVDLYFKTPIKDGFAAGKAIAELEGVVEHGLFVGMATLAIIVQNGVLVAYNNR